MPCIALAALPGMGYPADIFPTKRFWSRDLGDRDITQGSAGEIAAFQGDGIGCVPDRSELSKRTVARHIV